MVRLSRVAALAAPLRLAALAALAACSAEGYRESADEEVYGILDERRERVIGRRETFTVEPPAAPLRVQLEGPESRPVVELTLARALEVAAENSRDYQARKEQVYARALVLTLERWRLGFIPAVGAVGAVSGEGGEATDASGSIFGSVTRVLSTGAVVAADIGLGVFRTLTTSSEWRTLPSSLSLAVTQPILRGFGSTIVLEPLTQADREVVYEMRAFERYRQEFAVDVAARFYRILQQADVVTNERTNFENLTLVRERNEALAQAGRMSEIEVGQARQNELSARNRWVDAERLLESLQDAFKIFLGLPTGAAIRLDASELASLEEQGLLPVDATEAGALGVALEERLDLRTSRDRLEDAHRKVAVAADALRAGLDLSAAYANTTPEGAPFDFDAGNAQWEVALALDLPVDRLPERNAYRAALLALEEERRDASLAEDQVHLQVREAFREMKQARESHEIQRLAVALAESRVESADLYLQAGRSSTRDLLEAREALVQARNALTRALIDATLARLGLYRDVGALRLDSGGMHVDAGVLAALRGGMP